MSDPAHARAYRTLDGLRGVAALIVVTRHAGDFFPGGLFPESFLAVDLFFLLSGFVVAHAYEARLAAPGARLGFLRTRLIRLYPLYALGVALGFAAKVVESRASGQPLDGRWLAEAVLIGLAMLPAVPPLPMGSSTLDGPTWTLAPELLVNLVYAWTLRWLRGVGLWAVVAVGAVGLVLSEYLYGTLDGGWSVDRFPLIAARLAFSFFLGVAMFRAQAPRRVGGLAAWACLAVGGGALALGPHGHARQAYELLVVLLVFPAVVSLAVRREPDARSAPLFQSLGVLSYALYVLHQPLGGLLAPLLKPWPLFRAPTPLTAALFLTLAVALSLVVDQVYDRPVRRWLTRRSKPAPQPPPRRTSMRGGDLERV